MELTQSLQTDQVKHLRPKPPLLVDEDTTIRETIALMQQHREGCVIVCDASGRASGVFTERDVVSRVIGEQVALDTSIREVMSTKLVSVQEGHIAGVAIRLLDEHGLRHLPVVDEDSRPVGIVSVRRVLEYLVEHCPRAVYSQPPVSSVRMDTREGA